MSERSVETSGRVRRVARLIRHLPRFIRHWNGAINARLASDWTSVAHHLEAIHLMQLETDDSRFWLGSAHARLDDWHAAIDAFGRIEHPLPDQTNDAIRHVNHALALWNLDRPRECALLLRANMRSEWPEEQRRKARALLEKTGHSE